MQTKNTIPAEFIANSALLKNIEHMVQAQTENEAEYKPLATIV